MKKEQTEIEKRLDEIHMILDVFNNCADKFDAELMTRLRVNITTISETLEDCITELEGQL